MTAARLAVWAFAGLVAGTAAAFVLDAVAGTVWPRLAVGAVALTVGATGALNARRTPR